MKKLALVVLAALSVFAGQFPDNRYPRPADFARLLRDKFPKANLSCLGLERPEIQRIVGLNDPATGEPVVREPGPAFIRWYAPCVNQIISADFGEAYISDVAHLAMQAAFEREEKRLYGTARPKPSVQSKEWLLSVRWSHLTDMEKLIFTKRVVDHMIGPDVLEPVHLNKVIRALIAGLANTNFQGGDFLRSVGPRLAFGVAMREEFLLSPM